jgi:hypothetical protein
MFRMAPIVPWRTGAQDWDNLCHKRLEGRCRTSRTRQGSPVSGDRRSRLTGLDWAPMAWLFGFHALMASCERGRSADEEAKQPFGSAFWWKPEMIQGYRS